MVKLENLKKQYGAKTALSIPSLTVRKGEITGIVGNNGAGKTTLFKLLLDLIEASEGHALIDGIQVAESDLWKQTTGAFVDEKFLIDYLRPEEYFQLILELLKLKPNHLNQTLLPFEAFFKGEIMGFKKLIRDFSKGNQKKIGIAAAFLGHPKLILLDEPFTHLDPTSQLRLKDLIIHTNQSAATTFLISGHDLNNMVDTCNRILYMENGCIEDDLWVGDQTIEHLMKHFNIAYTPDI